MTTLDVALSEGACRTAVAARSGGACELGCGRAVEMSHRVSRGRGGLWTVGNILHLCSRSHAWLHANPVKAYAGGWFVETGADPAAVPVWLGVPYRGWWIVDERPADGGPHLLIPEGAGRPMPALPFG